MLGKIVTTLIIFLSFLGVSLPAFAALNYNVKNDTTSFFFVNGTSGNVGINTTIPVGKLEVNAGTSGPSKFVNVNGAFADLNGSRAGIYVNAEAATVGAFGAMGSWSQVRATDTAGNYTSALSGSYAEATQEGTATVDNLVGSLTLANQISNGPVTNAYGVYPQVWKGAGTITNAYGIYFQGVPTANGDTGDITGTLVNQYGVAIGNLTTATTRNVALLLDDNIAGAAVAGSYGVLQESTAANSFAGNVGVGTTEVSSQLTMHSIGPMLRDVHWNKDTTGATANESHYMVGTTAVNRPAPSDIEKFRFFAGYGSFQEVGQIGVTMPTAIGGVPQGAIHISTQGLTTGLTERMVIDSNIYMAANVGIGSSNPARLLEVGINPTIPSGATPVVAVKGDVAVDGKIYGDGSSLTGLPSGISGLTTNALPKASSATTLVDSGVYADVKGNLGVGITTPGQKLQVNGVTRSTSYEIVDGSSLINRDGSVLRVHGTAGLELSVWNGGYINALVIAPTTGNIGIATMTPRARLELVGTGSTTGAAFQIDDNLYNPKVTVLDNGNVGIGTILPGATMEVVGALRQTTSALNGSVEHSMSVNGSEVIWQVRPVTTNTFPALRLRPNGNPGGYGSSFEFYMNDSVTNYSRLLYVGYSQGHIISSDTLGTGVAQPIKFRVGTGDWSGIPDVLTLATSRNVGVGTTVPMAKLHVGVGNPTGTADLSSNSVLIKGNLEVDGKLYGDGSGLTNVAGSISGLTTYAVPMALSATTIVDSGIYVDTNGNVGIGTTAPKALFYSAYDSSSYIKMFDSYPASTGNILWIQSNNSVAPLLTVKGTGLADLVRLSNSTRTLMTFQNSGNLGVGTTAPLASIDIGVGTTGPAFMVSSNNGNSTHGDYLIVTSTGSVGIGTTVSLSSKLTIYGDVNPSFSIRDTDSSFGLYVGDYSYLDSSTGFVIRANGGYTRFQSTDYRFYIGSVDKVRISDQGNLGVGTNTPRAKLEVVASGSTTGTAFQIDDNLYNPKVTVLDNGNVGIGTTVPTAALRVIGANADTGIMLGGSNTWQSSYLEFVYDKSNYHVSRIGGEVEGGGGGGILFQTATTYNATYLTRMYVAMNGNIGMGTTVPVAELQVGSGISTLGADLSANSVLIKGNLEVDGKLYGDGSGITNLSGGISGLTTYAVPRASSATTIVDSGIYVDTNGNVGVGTTFPGAVLSTMVSNSTGIGLKITGMSRDGTIDNAEGVALALTHNSSGNRQFFLGDSASGDGIRFSSSSSITAFNYLSQTTQNLQIQSTGETTTFGYPLAQGLVTIVNGVTGANNANSVLKVVGDIGQTGDYIEVHEHGGNSWFSIKGTGNIGISTTSPRAKLEVVASGSTTGTAFQIDDNLYNPKVTVLDNGYVGIGTSVPNKRLTVGGGGIDGSFLVQASTNSEWFSVGSVGNGVVQFNAAGGTTRAGGIDLGARFNIVSVADNPILSIRGNEYGAQTNDLLRINGSGQTNGNLLKVTANGNLGVGTITPVASLHVGAGAPNAFDTSKTTNAYIAGDLEVDGKIYGDGSGITNVTGAISGLTAFAVPRALSSSTIVDSGIYVNASGSVGIGTTLPSGLLDVSGGLTVLRRLASNAVTSILSLNNTASDASGVGVQLGFYNRSNAANFLGGLKMFMNGNTSANNIDLQFYTGGDIAIPRMSIKGTGNIGIGSADPVAKLEIVGTGSTTGTAFQIDDNLYNPKVTVLDSGNVGIGTSVPVSKLSIKGNVGIESTFKIGGGVGYSSTGARAGYLEFYDPSYGQTILTNTWDVAGDAGGIAFQTGGSNTRMKIHHNGNVGVGTTIPVANLHVGAGSPTLGADLSSNSALIKGNLEVDGKIYGDGSGLTNVTGAISGLTAFAVPRALSSSTIVDSGIYLDANGNVGIGTISPNGDLQIVQSSVDSLGLLIKGAANSGAEDIIKVLSNNGGSTWFRMNQNGTIYHSGGFNEYSYIRSGQSGHVFGGWDADAVANTTFTLMGINATTKPLVVKSYPSQTANLIEIRSANATGGDIMAVLPDGNVGIGSSSPRAKFEVVASGSTTGTAFQIDDNLYNPKVTVLDNGNVGIGSTNPTMMFEVKGSSNGFRTGVDSLGIIRIINNNGVLNSSYLSLSYNGGNVYLENSYTGASLGGVQLRTNSTNGPIIFSPNLVEKVRIINNGNLGIGTSAPAAKLEVVASGSTTGTAFQIDDNLYNPKVTVLDNGNVGVGTVLPINNLNVKASAAEKGLTIEDDDSTSALEIFVNGGNSAFRSSTRMKLLNTAAYEMTFHTNNLERMRIGGGGNIGIGTVSTAALLHIGTGTPNAFDTSKTTNAYIAGDLEVDGKIYGDGSGIMNLPGGISGLTTYAVPMASSATSIVDSGIYVDASGNLGVGTTNPIFRMMVLGPGAVGEPSVVGGDANAIAIEGNGSARFIGRDTTNNIEFMMGTSVSGYSFAGTLTGHQLRLRTDNSDRLTILNTSGNVGIGTVVPLASLEVVKGGSAYSPFKVSSVSGGAGDYLMISSAGYVGIGTISPGYKLQIVDSNKTSYGNLDIYTNDSPAINKGGLISLGGYYTGTTPVVFASVGGRKENNVDGGIGGYLQLNVVNTSGSVRERMRISSDGNVGMGTIAPRAKLEVVGSGSTTGVAFQIDDNAYNPKVTVLDNGNVGIGSVAPAAVLSVNPGANAIDALNVVQSVNGGNLMKLQRSGLSQQLLVTEPNYGGSIGPGFYFSINSADGFLAWRSASSGNPELFLKNGNLGIGTNTPQARLHVGNGSARALPSVDLSVYGAFIQGNLEVDGKLYGDGSALTGISSGGLTWNNVSGTSQTMSVNNGYIANNAGLVTITLPATAAVGSVVAVTGGVSGTGGWKIAQNAGQTIHFGSSNTTTGATGYLSSNAQYDSVNLLCVAADTDFVVTSSVGNINVN